MCIGIIIQYIDNQSSNEINNDNYSYIHDIFPQGVQDVGITLNPPPSRSPPMSLNQKNVGLVKEKKTNKQNTIIKDIIRL